jgi:hypothetical protein
MKISSDTPLPAELPGLFVCSPGSTWAEFPRAVLTVPQAAEQKHPHGSGGQNHVKVSQGCAPKSRRGHSFPPPPGWWLAALGVPWPVDTVPMAPSLSVCVWVQVSHL